MATRTASNRARKSEGGITLDDHSTGNINALDRGKVQGIAMAVVVAESPTSNRGDQEETTTRDRKKCAHEPDFTTAGIAFYADAGCDVGVTCGKCGEDGFAYVTATGIVWNDED